MAVDQSPMNKLITEHIDIWTSAVKTKSASGRGSNKKLELYGVKKLRELILELAVRGKLVSQDPSDEPASVLLERIAQEKAQLVKDKKIKKTKPLSSVKEQEKTFDIPRGWSWTRIGLITTFVNGFAFKSSSFQDSGVGIVKIGDISFAGELTPNTMSRVDTSVIKDLDPSLRVNRGDMVIAMSGATTGKVGFNTTNEVFYLNQRVGKFIPHQIDLDYLFFPLTTKIAENLEKSLGSAIPNLSTGQINDIVIALPPLQEQHRIVAKVDELMALCDQLEQQTEASIEAHQVLVTTLLDTLTNSADADELMQNWARISEHFDTLFTTEESIDQLKQTILQLAVMGKLVPRDPSDEPAAELLKRIAEEKAQLVKDKKIKKQKALPPISEDEKPFELPNGWEWCRIQDVALFTTSGSRDWAKYYSDSGALFVTMGNLSRGSYELRLDNLRFVRPPKGGEGSRTKLEARDLLISITGDVGNLGLIPEEFGEAYINQHTCLLRFMPECQGKYFPDFMRSPLAKYQFDAPQRGIKNSFRLSDVGEMHLPLPPLNEQVRITEKVSDLLSICERLKVRLRESQITQLHLTDAIVERAV
ncbi:restriction endonuclease subunit S [Vibrio nereis]|uniref:restriction endonuclease subunit S n=1 Tax=Vibrio nereis TaxID=693 RepID=UPI0024951872|nr:restriction endonuclease subunit S [Vibrio nereis]